MKPGDFALISGAFQIKSAPFFALCGSPWRPLTSLPWRPLPSLPWRPLTSLLCMNGFSSVFRAPTTTFWFGFP